MPFTYLGIPISHKKLSVLEGRVLIEKMVGRIKTWSSKHLSYAGRCVLINAVLVAIQAYWSQILILPARIIKEIKQVCRAFLWRGKEEFLGPGAVAWSSICKAKSGGGLGFKDVKVWNKAAVFKHIWAIAEKKDSLWLKWIHHEYLKRDGIWEHEAPAHSTWQWKKMIEIKNEARNLFKDRLGAQYSIGKGYKFFEGNQLKVQWSKQVWNRWSYPKHNFLFWLAIQNRLATRERISRFKPNAETECLLCRKHVENVEHLFFKCEWSNNCLTALKQWLNWSCTSCTLHELCRTVQNQRGVLRRKVTVTAMAALIYSIWHTRNQILWEGKCVTEEQAFGHIKTIVKMRISGLLCTKGKDIDREWLSNL